jgi:magnesium and cobalt exporter, CNNM family
MMSPLLIAAIILLAVLGTLVFSTLTYSLRDFSRARLSEYLDLHGRGAYLERTVDYRDDLIFITAFWRLLFNVLILLGFLALYARTRHGIQFDYVMGTITTLLITLIFSVAVPTAAARYAGEQIIGAFVKFLHGLRIAMLPVTKIRHGIDDLVRRAAGASDEPEAEEIEQEIMSVVEEGEKEGVVDEEEREMIESVIEFRDTQAGQIMSARPEIVGLDLRSSLMEVKRTLEESGHSRIPVYDGTLDHIVGILYARDLLKHLGLPPDKFDIRSAIRPAVYVPETKPLRDLLNDFRLQKVHIAIVVDEYGGTAGLVTIEDILEELVGDISDEHEASEPAMLKRIDDQTWEADARVYLDELNRQVGLNIPEDQGYDTLGGFISTTLGRIPTAGTVFEHQNVKYTIIDAEPQKVNRAKIELQPVAVEAGAGAQGTQGVS